MIVEAALRRAVVVNVVEQRERMREGRLSVPGPGHTISAITEERAVHIRRAVQVLEGALRSTGIDGDFMRMFAPRWEAAAPQDIDESAVTRAAWALTNVWLLARSIGAIGPDAKFAESEQWFIGVHRDALPSLAAKLPGGAEQQALSSLSEMVFDHGFRDLLPYLLEPYGPGSRLSVMRDPGTRVAREAKRRNGVYYTPADVAEYMVERVLAEHGGLARELRCLDPSCGTGIFLLALMQTVERAGNEEPFNRLEYAVRCLYGFDVSPLAVDTCVFVLLHECLPDVMARGVTSWCAWQALRLNFAAVDALKVRRETLGNDSVHIAAVRSRESIRAQLLDPTSTEMPLPNRALQRLERRNSLRWIGAGDGRLSLEAIYPEAAEGFDVIIGNPPYASLGLREDGAFLSGEYACLSGRRITGSENVYPLFVEMMWRLTGPGTNASALVVPLSIAYHQGKQYSACRESMTLQGGRWSFAFFDREPHALFGEDVKTRNAILFRRERDSYPQRGCAAEIETGPLRKWTSRTREQLFSSISYTPLGRIRLTRGIPKLHGKEQARAFAVLSSRADVMRTFWRCAWTCLPIDACREAYYPKVFVASTAYNFLNVFRSLAPVPGVPYPLSQNRVLCLEFVREELAEIAFAILSSRLVYWLWHVQGDGFHVARWFVESIPFGRSSFDTERVEVLKQQGRRLWQALQDHRIVSVNGGRQTIAYRPLSCEGERDVIDAVLIDAAGISKTFLHTLRIFVQSTVVVDGADDRRRHLKSFFDLQEGSP